MAVALIVAAGSGERLGGSVPKAFIPCAGRPLVAWSIDAFRAVDGIDRIVVAVPPGWTASTDGDVEALEGCVVCEGGSDRSLSVRAALSAAGDLDDSQVVLVHDAARPFVERELIERLMAAVAPGAGCEAAIAATQVTDTIKVANEDGNVLSTLDRGTLRAVQTPQAFTNRALAQALDQGEDVLAAATDDAALAEALGLAVQLVDSPSENFKVTTQNDLDLAELILGRRAKAGAPR
ncbi:MAG: 2-C-methyl-D-erythritol 4-phosphate cytidylyltransferase [Actinomycetes bacterium]